MQQRCAACFNRSSAGLPGLLGHGSPPTFMASVSPCSGNFLRMASAFLMPFLYCLVCGHVSKRAGQGCRGWQGRLAPPPLPPPSQPTLSRALRRHPRWRRAGGIIMHCIACLRQPKLRQAPAEGHRSPFACHRLTSYCLASCLNKAASLLGSCLSAAAAAPALLAITEACGDDAPAAFDELGRVECG